MQEKLSKLKYKFKTEVKSGKSGYMLYAAVLAGIFCIAVLKTGGKAFFGGTGGITQTV